MSDKSSENLNILLKTAENKHEAILSNIRAIDTKASIILAFFGVLFIPSADIFQWTIRKNEFFIIKLLPGIFIVIGIVFCLMALLPQKIYAFPQLVALEDLYYNHISPNQLKAELFSYYREGEKENGKLARRKIRMVKIALYFLVISFSLTILLYILKGVIDV